MRVRVSCVFLGPSDRLCIITLRGSERRRDVQIYLCKSVLIRLEFRFAIFEAYLESVLKMCDKTYRDVLLLWLI